MRSFKHTKSDAFFKKNMNEREKLTWEFNMASDAIEDFSQQLEFFQRQVTDICDEIKFWENKKKTTEKKLKDYDIKQLGGKDERKSSKK